MTSASLDGPTETVAATWYQIPPATQGVVPIGRPISGREVILLDELDRECPPGVVGEIVVRSPYVTSGYLGDQPGDPAFRAVPGVIPGPGLATGRPGQQIGRCAAVT